MDLNNCKLKLTRNIFKRRIRVKWACAVWLNHAIIIQSIILYNHWYHSILDQLFA